MSKIQNRMTVGQPIFHSLANCKSCGQGFEIVGTGYHSGLCDRCKAASKLWMLGDPVLAAIAQEYQKRYGRIWTG